jgi:hypothetical protein
MLCRKIGIDSQAIYVVICIVFIYNMYTVMYSIYIICIILMNSIYIICILMNSILYKFTMNVDKINT